MNNIESSIKIIKAICNSNRIAILSLLHKTKKDLCVKEIAEKVNISQSLASHQLAYLEGRGFVDSERMGQTICYKLSMNKETRKIIQIINILK
jgi:DNA-binding transcriptional ArsR family regulator